MLFQEEVVITKAEQKKIDRLFGMALFDDDIRDRLVTQRDEALLIEYGLSSEIQGLFREVRAETLTDLAKRISEVTTAV